MKKILLIFLLIGCSQSLDREKAVKVTELLIRDIKSNKYSELTQYYTKDFFQNYSQEKWINDLYKLGVIQSYKLIGSNVSYDPNEGDKITIEYIMMHKTLESRHVFILIIEDGAYKIFGHHIKVEDLVPAVE